MRSNRVLIFLRNELALRKRRNPRYSVRAFARQLGISSSALSQVLSGSRPLTISFASRILTALEMDEQQRVVLLLSLHQEISQEDPMNIIR